MSLYPTPPYTAGCALSHAVGCVYCPQRLAGPTWRSGSQGWGLCRVSLTAGQECISCHSPVTCLNSKGFCQRAFFSPFFRKIPYWDSSSQRVGLLLGSARQTGRSATDHGTWPFDLANHRRLNLFLLPLVCWAQCDISVLLLTCYSLIIGEVKISQVRWPCSSEPSAPTLPPHPRLDQLSTQVTPGLFWKSVLSYYLP